MVANLQDFPSVLSFLAFKGLAHYQVSTPLGPQVAKDSFPSQEISVFSLGCLSQKNRHSPEDVLKTAT